MRIIIACLLSLLCSGPLLAQCELISRWGERGLTRDIAIEGNTVVAADERGIAVYETSNPEAMRQTGALRTNGRAIAIEAVDGGFAVLTERGIELLRVENGVPSRIWASETFAATDLSCEGALCAATSGLSLDRFRITPSGFERVGSTQLPARADSVLLRGPRVYAGAGSLSTVVIDSSTGNAITELGAVALDLAASGTRVYAASGGSGLTVIEDSPSPSIVARHFVSELDLRMVLASGDEVFAWDALTSRIVRVDPSRGVIESSVDESPKTIALSGDRLYTALPGRPLRVRRASDLSLLGDFEDRQGPLTGVATDGSYAYVADPPLFRVIDVRDRLNPREIASLPLDDSADRVGLRSGMAIVYGRANVHLVDISEPRHPRYHGVFRSLGTIPNDAAFAGELLLEGNRASGFHVLDISDPSNPRQIGGLKNDFYGQYAGLAARPGAAYGFTSRVVKVIDLGNPRIPRVARVITGLNVLDVAIAHASSTHSELLLVLDADRIRIFDISQPLEPLELGSVHVEGAREISASTEVAYASTRFGEILRIDLSGGAARVSHTAALSSPAQIAIAPGETEIAVADGDSLVWMRDLAAAESPLDTPALSVLSVSGTAAHLTWTGSAGASYEVETSGSDTFAAAQRSETFTNSASVTVQGTTFVRVRATSGCAVSEWSNAVAIDGSAEGTLAFGTTGQRIITGRDAPTTVQVTVFNRGSAPAEATLQVTSSFAIAPRPGGVVDMPQSRTIQPGAAESFTLTMWLPAGETSGTVRLGIAGSPSEHLVRLTKLTAQTSSRSAGDLLVLPGVAATPGSNGTVWKSDLNLLCRGAEPCSMEIAFNEFGTLAAAKSIQLALEPGESSIIRDAVVRLFEASPASGAFEIRSARLDSILASAYTYNEAPKGRFGQRITAQRVDGRSGTAPRRSRLHGIAQNGTFRTNIGLVNASGSPQRALLRLGQHSAAIDLRPWEGVQHSVTTIFSGLAATDGDAVEVDAPARIVVYQSRVDQRTGDGTFSLSQPIGAEAQGTRFIRTMTVAAKSPGAQGTFWRTAVQLASDSPREETLLVTFVPAVDPSRAMSRTLAIGSSGLFGTDDVFDWLAVPSEFTYGMLRVESNAPFTGWGRIYNDAATGTFGQYVPLEEASPAAAVLKEKAAHFESPAALQIFPVEENTERRTNFGVAEVSGRPATLRLEIYDSAGGFLGAHERAMPAFGSQPLFEILSPFRGATGLRVEVESEGLGELRVYASTVETATGDAVYISAE
jgi:hypothetical protein